MERITGRRVSNPALLRITSNIIGINGKQAKAQLRRIISATSWLML
jgi:hypothetical protein